MTGRILDGKRVAEGVLERLRVELPSLSARLNRAPGLAVILAGHHAPSEVYVRNKLKAAAKLGVAADVHRLPQDADASALSGMIARLNADDRIDGILLQLPIPAHLDPYRFIEEISPDKDVDGFHPINLGRAWNERPAFIPCTPLAVREVLRSNGLETSGKHVVICGRGMVVGRPLSSLLAHRGPTGDATVTVCHLQTRHMEHHTRLADVLIAAMGAPERITGDMVKPGAIVIDVGINAIADAASPNGRRIVGDVHFESVSKVAGAITPVPGGVGPVTIAMLLSNVMLAAEARLSGGLAHQHRTGPEDDHS